MHKLMSSLTPNQVRLVYDALVAVGVSVFVFLFLQRFLDVRAWALFLQPLLLLAANGALGIYGRHKVSTGPRKILLLSVSVLSAASALWVLSGLAPAALLWGALIWSPLVLPRYLLNLRRRRNYGLVTSALNSRTPIAVIGGAGYIGTHVLEQLLRTGHQVRLLDRLMYGRQPLEELRSNPNLTLIEGDATDIGKLVETLNGVGTVIHLGGLVGDPAAAVNEDLTRHMNVIATRMVRDVALSFGVSRFVFASSCSVYGVSDVPVREGDTLSPLSLYAHTKIDSEHELLGTVDEYFYPTVLRFATVFGHSRRPRFDLVGNLFTAQAMIDGVITVHGGAQWRPFIHARDLARAVLMVIKSDPNAVRGEIFNVGDERLNMTIGQLAERVRTIVSRVRPVELRIDESVVDRRNYSVSFEKIRARLGFQAETLADEGIEEIVREFQKGTYGNYRDAIYDNAMVTRHMLEQLQDPLQALRLYRPLSEAYTLAPDPRARTLPAG